MDKKYVIVALIVLLVVTNVITYFSSRNLGGVLTATQTLVEYKTVTTVLTITSLVTITAIPVSIRTPVSAYHVELGEPLNVVTPFLYHRNTVLYSENLTDVASRWIFEGSYKVLENGVLVSSKNITCSIAYNKVVTLRTYTVYRVEVEVLRNNGSVRFTLYSPTSKRHVASILIDKNMVATGYLGDNVAPYQRQIDLGNVSKLEFMFIYIYGNSGELFLKTTRHIDSDWVLVAQITSPLLTYLDVKIGIEACNSDVLIKDFKVNPAAGTGMRDLRPIFDWSNGKYNPKSILMDKDGYYLFFATESYFNSPARLLILRTKDLIHYEPVKSVVVKTPGYTGQGVLFKWIDNKIHGFLMDWTSGPPPYQQGLHRILKVTMDEKFNVLEINTNVKLMGGPSGGNMGHYDIALMKFHGTWYAVTSSFSGGTIVWRLEDPTKTVFTYVKTIFPSGFENPCIYPVVAPNGSIRFMMSVATMMVHGVQYHRIYILDEKFNPIEYYDLTQIKVYSGGQSFYLDPWYIFVNQDQFPERRLVVTDIGPGVYLEIYRLNTPYKYYIEE